MHAHAHAHTRTHTRTRARTQGYMHVVRIRMHFSAHAYKCVYVHICIYICIYVQVKTHFDRMAYVTGVASLNPSEFDGGLFLQRTPRAGTPCIPRTHTYRAQATAVPYRLLPTHLLTAACSFRTHCYLLATNSSRLASPTCLSHLPPSLASPLRVTDSREFFATNATDVAFHSYDLEHGVEVSS